jgi:peroxiredoxin
MAAKQNRILQEGARAPEVQGLGIKGPVLLVFFKITCPVCQFTLPFLNRIHRAGTLPVYGISQNDAADTREFNQEFGIEFPVVLDSEDAGYPASNAYGISSVPSLFLVEPDGKIGRVIEGWSRKEMEWLGGCAGAAVIRQGDNVPEWKAG